MDQQWALLQRNRQPATAEEKARYTSYRITHAPTARATFKRGDLDLASFQMIRETASHAEFQGRFREDLTDPMIHHLELILTVAKQPAAIEQYLLRLIEPYSPILSVKMMELEVRTRLSDRATPGLSMPQTTTSHFRGRILFIKSIEEDIETSYADFTAVTPLLDPAPAAP